MSRKQLKNSFKNAKQHGSRSVPVPAGSFWEKVRQKAAKEPTQGAQIQIKTQSLANDNQTRRAISKLQIVAIALTAIMFVLIFTLKSSEIATTIITHADSKTLETLMEINPELLGSLLNAATVGE